jgi:hypothetical protein
MGSKNGGTCCNDRLQIENVAFVCAVVVCLCVYLSSEYYVTIKFRRIMWEFAQFILCNCV